MSEFKNHDLTHNAETDDVLYELKPVIGADGGTVEGIFDAPSTRGHPLIKLTAMLRGVEHPTTPILIDWSPRSVS